jgi:hypothetical protein
MLLFVRGGRFTNAIDDVGFWIAVTTTTDEDIRPLRMNREK